MAQQQTSAVGHVILLLSGRRKISPGSPLRFYAALAIRQETPTDGTRLLRRDCIGRRADGGFRYIPLSNIGSVTKRFWWGRQGRANVIHYDGVQSTTLRGVTNIPRSVETLCNPYVISLFY
ncbi:hypothetical protein PCANC_07648 [Puccinia coronata f. sp. avenae]|uniref:Uncharacterized protein n=1 Tax=Puccinia coronata f. sp. avenae TaxID=200324 RepID=A0A2N5T2R0_9BASI|nr:hypothetical protein PCANC_07648 [Puccinia coronata f. sp. avenae]PLW40990.1 hypothetical protein PCASD_06599 [Puccinia coronata f. sp. avenae]